MDAEAWCDLTAGDDNVCWRRCPSVREYDRIDDGRWPARRSADANSKGSRLTSIKAHSRPIQMSFLDHSQLVLLCLPGFSPRMN
nr:hypothetical protein Iba_chr01aCG12260 [Ipomoea batatas]